MGQIKGDRTVEIEAPIERCYEIAADVENATEWQGSLKDVEVLERDGERRPVLVETESDAKVKTVRAVLRFSYDPPTGIRWVQEKGDTKSLVGSWAFCFSPSAALPSRKSRTFVSAGPRSSRPSMRPGSASSP